MIIPTFVSNKLLHGAGQIMLQENKWTGLFFIVGLFVSSWKFGVACVIAIIVATLTAGLLKYKQQNIDAGLYGFNAALIGIALIFFFDDTIIIWLLIVVGSILSSLLQHFFITKKIPAFTFPFIIITWAIYFLLHQYYHVQPSVFIQEKFTANEYDKYFFIFRNFGQVIFQSSIVASVLFFIGVLFNNYIAAVYALVISALSALLFYWIGFEINQMLMGLFGFNIVLTVIAFAGNKKSNFIWIFIGAIITIIIHFVLIKTNILNRVGGVLTFPFVAATWITLFIQKFSKKGIS
ncbi:MAG: urea transporter [Chitinophagaceae bacterium]|nr:urea transporter [Chitinophagaceae bacterium]MCW5905799.1 urea transporter [Chitinophagaceae bacterium]